MADRHEDAISFEALSALADNEASERDIQRACSAWREQPEARERWQSYQLIGDVMRSEGLARAKSSDADFLAGVRARLDQEAVVLAPAALPTAAHASASAPQVASLADARALRHRRWAGPLSVAAGFVMVISAVVSTLNTGGVSTGGQGGDVMALAPVSGSVTQDQAFVGHEMGLTGVMPAGLTADGGPQLVTATPTFNENVQDGAGTRRGYLVFMRDDQLDQLMAAQREQGANRSLASPQGGGLQSVSFGAASR